MADTNDSIDIFNREEALENMGGSEELLAELIDALKAELPQLVEAIRKGVTDQCSETVSRAAHSLKGSVMPFAAKRAYEAAWAIEEPSSQGELGNINELLQRLESELASLVAALDQSTG